MSDYWFYKNSQIMIHFHHHNIYGDLQILLSWKLEINNFLAFYFSFYMKQLDFKVTVKTCVEREVQKLTVKTCAERGVQTLFSYRWNVIIKWKFKFITILPSATFPNFQETYCKQCSPWLSSLDIWTYESCWYLPIIAG